MKEESIRLNKDKYVVTKEDLAKVNDIYTKPSVSYCPVFDDGLTIESTWDSFDIDRESIYEIRRTEKSLIFYVKYGIKIEVEIEGK